MIPDGKAIRLTTRQDAWRLKTDIHTLALAYFYNSKQNFMEAVNAQIIFLLIIVINFAYITHTRICNAI